jgi:hypothetical protein
MLLGGKHFGLSALHGLENFEGHYLVARRFLPRIVLAERNLSRPTVMDPADRI